MAQMTKDQSFWQSKRRQDKIMSLILFLIAWAGALIFVVPLIWMISTSLKTPTDIFTIPPKWIPVSDVFLTYDTKLTAKKSGVVKITKREDGLKEIDIKKTLRAKETISSTVVPEAGVIKVGTGDYVKEGDVVATMPNAGVIKTAVNPDGTNLVRVYDKKRILLREFQLPKGITMKVKDGDTVKQGDRIAVINPQWRNYMEAWAPKALNETFNRYLWNTILITTLGILGVILSSTFVAYGFARFRFPLRDPLFLIMISTMMIPAQVTMIPTFILFKYMGWIDTFLPLIVPAYFGGGAFNIFLMRQFFMTIPYELDDAAKIDGCNFFQIFWIILMPLVKPAIATVAIFGFVYNWNDFLNPLIYLNSSSNYTLALGLQTFTTMYGSYYHLMMAASTIVLLPILIVFFFGQRFFIEGVATSGLKG